MKRIFDQLKCFWLGHPVKRIAESTILTKELCERCGRQFVGNKEIQYRGYIAMIPWVHNDPTLTRIFEEQIK